MRRLTFETQGRNRFPVWSPDGQYVTFQSDREGDPSVFRQRADSSTPAERLTKADEGESHIPDAWSPDGAHLLYNVRKRDASELWMLSLKDGKAARFGDVQSPGAVLSGATFSPDGRWVAYSSRGSRGTSIVYVQPFPPSGAKFQISKDTEDGHHAVWSADGTELIYVEGLGLPVGAVRVTTKPTFAFSEAQPLQTTFVRDSPTTVRTFDIMRDGRFLGFTSVSQDFDRRPDGTPASPAFQIVLNWFEELRAKVPTSP
jgi:Tol biopolymer transport system component